MAEVINYRKPKVIYKKRPFLSIVIAYYNGENTIRALLDSILEQEGMEEEIEVILADDCSPHQEEFLQVLADYEDKISLKAIKTDYNYAPGNTRERGTMVAEGKWLAFADQDDLYIPNTLGEVKSIIEEAREQYYAVAAFYEIDRQSGKVLRELKEKLNWNHAKFYNLDNLWKAQNIHFKKDLLTHEDIYISSCINCACRNLGIRPLFIDKYIYKWMANPNTISRQKYDGHMFLEMFFKDYLESTGEVYLAKSKTGDLERRFGIGNCIQVILFCYFYLDSFHFHQNNKYMYENDEYARDYIVRVKEFFNVDNKQIYDVAAANTAQLYNNTLAGALIGTGPYIPTMTFKDWLDYIHKDIGVNTNIQETLKKKNMEILNYGDE